MKEKVVERKLVKAVRDSGGLALKFVSPGLAGVPDRQNCLLRSKGSGGKAPSAADAPDGAVAGPGVPGLCGGL